MLFADITYTLGPSKQFCGEECRQQHVGKQRRKHRKKHKRIRRNRIRASAYGVEYQRFDPNEVFERDEWTCQACGCDTPKQLRGTHDDNSPELDHIVPISNGGPHTIENTQCLCRLCNMLKSTTPMSDFVAEYAGG